MLGNIKIKWISYSIDWLNDNLDNDNDDDDVW